MSYVFVAAIVCALISSMVSLLLKLLTWFCADLFMDSNVVLWHGSFHENSSTFWISLLEFQLLSDIWQLDPTELATDSDLNLIHPSLQQYSSTVSMVVKTVEYSMLVLSALVKVWIDFFNSFLYSFMHPFYHAFLCPVDVAQRHLAWASDATTAALCCTRTNRQWCLVFCILQLHTSVLTSTFDKRWFCLMVDVKISVALLSISQLLLSCYCSK